MKHRQNDANQPIFNVQTLHLVEVHLDRVARKQAALRDNVSVGQDKFSGLLPDDRGKYDGETNNQRYHNHSKRGASTVSSGGINAEPGQQE